MVDFLASLAAWLRGRGITVEEIAEAEPDILQMPAGFSYRRNDRGL